MSEIRASLIVAGLCLVNTATAQTDIYKCTAADGGAVYSQLPCTTEKPVEVERTEADPKAETTESKSAEDKSTGTDYEQEQSESDEIRAVCKKRHRDAIDAIDAEIRREYSPEKNDQYKQRLLALTRKLRQC